MDASFALRARFIVPIDHEPIEGGVVTVAGGKIVSVNRRADGGAPVHDLGDVALLPGFVNAHTHLEFSDFPAPLGEPGIDMPTWIRLVIASRTQKGRSPREAIADGLSESLRCGVTTIGEIQTASAIDYFSADDGNGTPRPYMRHFQESIGFSNARVESALELLASQMHANQTELESFGHGERTMMGLGVSPHAPYTVNPKLLQRLVELATARKLPVAMHLAESPEEMRLLAGGDGPLRDLLEERSMWDPAAIPLGSRPLWYLEQLARAPRALVVHGGLLSDDELEFLADRRDRMSLVYCPRTHGFFQRTSYPLAEALAHGVRVAIGTDSRASNPDLSVLREMQCAFERRPSIAPREILKMGTQYAADAIGWGDAIGAIAPGKIANLAAAPIAPRGAGDVETQIVANAPDPIGVWLCGERVV